jgi:hypothetical protein
MLHRLVEFFSSLKLTVVCLTAALVLVFAGTLAQVNAGITEVQGIYFHSLFVWWPASSQGFRIPIFPGGHLIGAVLLINLITAHLTRFRWSWKKLGIHLTHLGLIILLVGGLFTDLFSIESFMRLAPGETKNYSEDPRLMELVAIDESDKELDTVTAIPEAMLTGGATITHESLPFRIIVRRFYRNSLLQPLSKTGKEGHPATPASTQGVGAQVTVQELPRATAQNERDEESVVIEVVPIPEAGAVTAPSIGTWLLSDQLGAPQGFSMGGRSWRLALRPVRYYKPYSLTLKRFTHDRYPGTQIPKNFASQAVLVDPERGENRDVLIYMNHPLRYRGETFFQSGFTENDAATILQDVHNPSFLTPYLACVVVGLGLLIQFLIHFIGFLQRRKVAKSA